MDLESRTTCLTWNVDVLKIVSCKSRSDKLDAARIEDRKFVSRVLQLSMFLSLCGAASGGGALRVFNSDQNIKKYCLGYKLHELFNERLP